MTASSYTFRPATRDDLPMLREWLCTPEPMRWWGDPEHEYGLLEEDLENPGLTMLIVSHLGRAFAYAQHYEVHTWPQPHMRDLPRGLRAIDAFIGVPEMLGIGHGAAFLRVLALELKEAGAPAIAIDPDVENLRARRAYERAGFRGDTVVDTEAGLAVLMLFSGSVLLSKRVHGFGLGAHHFNAALAKVLDGLELAGGVPRGQLRASLPKAEVVSFSP